MKNVSVSLIVIIVAFLHPYAEGFVHDNTALASGIESRNITGKISFGYDDNIFEQAESKTGRSFLRLYLDSKLPLLRSKRLGGVLRLQDGFKIVGKGENVALNQVNLRFALRISPQITSEILSELKHKSVSVSQNLSAPSEYGYLNWHSGVSLKFNLRNFSSNLRYLRFKRDYADSDIFDSKIRQIFAMTNVFFPRKLTTSFMAGWLHSHFPQLLVHEQKAKPSQLIAQQKTAHQERIDDLCEFRIGLQWVGRILINPNYAFQRNSSNSTEYSFHAHQVSILTASPLCFQVTMQLYGRLQLRKYDSQKTPLFHPPDEDNTEQARNVIIFSLTRDIFKNCSLEARYLLSQSTLPSSSMRYTKQSYLFTMNYSF